MVPASPAATEATLLARSQTLPLTEAGIVTPLLVPSVSSKGFPLVDGVSEAGAVLPLVIDELDGAVLISAYDIHHRLVPDADRLGKDYRTRSLYGSVPLLVVDSGGYELSQTFEAGEPRRGPYRPAAFNRGDFEAVVDRLPAGDGLLVVTYDEPDPARPGYAGQLAAARDFADTHPGLQVDWLVKPVADAQHVVPRELLEQASELGEFAVIGVTEKELGDSIVDRVVCLIELRRVLDEAGCQSLPIHLFGALGPALTSLYFMAGAELFDGLSWLRYAYYDDLSVHPEELSIRSGAWDAPQVLRAAQRYLSNIRYLAGLRQRLIGWANDPEQYELLGRHHTQLREAYEAAQRELGGRHRGR